MQSSETTQWKRFSIRSILICFLGVAALLVVFSGAIKRSLMLAKLQREYSVVLVDEGIEVYGFYKDFAGPAKSTSTIEYFRSEIIKLHVSNVTFTDYGFLSDLPSCKSLNFSGHDLNGPMIQKIADLPALEEIVLLKCRLEDEDLKLFVRAKQLKKLIIGANKFVSHTAILELMEANPSIVELDVSAAPLDVPMSEFESKFRASFPNCLLRDDGEAMMQLLDSD